MCCAFEVKIAEFSRTPEDFLKKYDELKSKNTRNLDPLVYLLSKLTEDKEVTAVMRRVGRVREGECGVRPWGACLVGQFWLQTHRFAQ